MKKTMFLTFIVLLSLFSVHLAYGAMTNTIATKPNADWWSGATGSGRDKALLWAREVEAIIEDGTLENGNLITFDNGGTISNVTDTVLIFTEEAETLRWLFADTSITASSTTGVVLINHGTIVPAANQFLVNPVSAAVGTVEGTIRYDAEDNTFYGRDNDSWEDLAAASTFAGGSVTGDIVMANGIYLQSTETTAQASAIQVWDTTTTASYTNVLSWLNQAVPDIVLGSATSTLALTSTGLNVTTAGAVSGVTTIVAESADFTAAAGVTFENDGTITNSVDGTFLFTDGGESLSVYLNNDIATLGTGTSVATLEFGVVDALTGVDEVTFDTATTSTVTKASAAHADLTVSMSGAVDASLILSSTGTGDDALQITTTAGGIDITNGGAAGGTEDIDIDGVLASLNLNADEDVADALTITTSAGGIDITADGGTGSDLDLTCTNGSINIKSGENHAGAMLISTGGGGGTGEIMTILNDQGNTDNSIDIDSTAGGLDIDMAGSIALTSTEGSADSVYLHSNGGGLDITAATNGSEDMDIAVTGTTDSHLILTCAGTSENAMQLTTTAGGIELLNGGETDGEDLELTSTTESVILNGGEDAATAITLYASNAAGGIDVDCGSAGINIDASAGAFTVIGELPSTIYVTSNTDSEDLTISVAGTGDSSLLMTSIGTADDAFSVQVGGAGGGIDMDAGANGLINIAGSNDLTITVVGGTNGEDILITNTTTAECSITLENTGGTVADAIGIHASGVAGGVLIDTDNGKIDLNTDGAANGDIDIDAADQILISSDDADGTDSILITTTTGASSNLKIYNVAGTGAAALELLTGAGGITMTSTGASDGDMFQTVGDVWTVDVAGAIVISSGDVAAAGDIAFDAEAASFSVDAGEDVDNAIALICTGGDGGIDITGLGDIDITTTGDTDHDILITNAAGSIAITSNEAITSAVTIEAGTAGGGIDITSQEDIDITTTGAGGEDITLSNAGGSILLTSTEADANSIEITSVGADAGIDIRIDGGINIRNDSVPDTDSGLFIRATGTDATQTSALALKAWGVVAGNPDGSTGASNHELYLLTGSTTGAHHYWGLKGKIYEAGATCTNSVVYPLYLETQVDSTNPPAIHTMIRFNTDQSGDTPDVMFMAANTESIAYTANLLHGTSAGDKTGAIKIKILGTVGDGSNNHYIYTYKHPGQ